MRRRRLTALTDIPEDSAREIVTEVLDAAKRGEHEDVEVKLFTHSMYGSSPWRMAPCRIPSFSLSVRRFVLSV